MRRLTTGLLAAALVALSPGLSSYEALAGSLASSAGSVKLRPAGSSAAGAGAGSMLSPTGGKIGSGGTVQGFGVLPTVAAQRIQASAAGGPAAIELRLPVKTAAPAASRISPDLPVAGEALAAAPRIDPPRTVPRASPRPGAARRDPGRIDSPAGAGKTLEGYASALVKLKANGSPAGRGLMERVFDARRRGSEGASPVVGLAFGRAPTNSSGRTLSSLSSLSSLSTLSREAGEGWGEGFRRESPPHPSPLPPAGGEGKYAAFGRWVRGAVFAAALLLPSQVWASAGAAPAAAAAPLWLAAAPLALPIAYALRPWILPNYNTPKEEYGARRFIGEALETGTTLILTAIGAAATLGFLGGTAVLPVALAANFFLSSLIMNAALGQFRSVVVDGWQASHDQRYRVGGDGRLRDVRGRKYGEDRYERRAPGLVGRRARSLIRLANIALASLFLLGSGAWSVFLFAASVTALFLLEDLVLKLRGPPAAPVEIDPRANR